MRQEAAGEFRSFALRSWRSDGIKHKKNEIFLDVARGPGSEVRSELVAWFVSFSVQGGAPQSPGFCKRVCSAFGDLGGIEDEATLLLIACVCSVQCKVVKVASYRPRSYLSGMPELKLGLNDKLLFEAMQNVVRSAHVSAMLRPTVASLCVLLWLCCFMLCFDSVRLCTHCSCAIL